MVHHCIVSFEYFSVHEPRCVQYIQICVLTFTTSPSCFVPVNHRNRKAETLFLRHIRRPVPERLGDAEARRWNPRVEDKSDSLFIDAQVLLVSCPCYSWVSWVGCS